MNIERDKKYVLSDGRVVRVICTDCASPFAPIIGLQQPDEDRVLWFLRNGAQYSSEVRIVTEYREPRIAYCVETSTDQTLFWSEENAREEAKLRNGTVHKMREVIE